MCENIIAACKENLSPCNMPGSRKEITSLMFNQEHNLFTCAMETGLRIYNVNPLEITTSIGQ